LYVVGGEWVNWFGGLTCDFWAVFEGKILSGKIPGQGVNFSSHPKASL
jgi:hypothetical protein